MMNYSLVIFDLDGTILDTLEDLKISVNAALSSNGLPKRTLDEVRAFVGNGIRLLMERAVPEGASAAMIDRVHQAFTAHYKVHCADHTKPYDEILPLLDTLKGQHIKTAVVSNKADYAVQELCAQYFPDAFDYVTGEKTGINKKPAPDSVNNVLEVLSIPKDQAVYVGDSEVDIQTAKNAGMDMIIVNWGFRDEAYLVARGASNIVSTPHELLEKINNRT